MSSSPFDFDWLRSTLRNGAREAFSHVVSINPSERFYAFALYSMSDQSGIYPAANSIEGFRSQLKRYREIESLRNRPIKSFGRELRWSTPEWKYQGKEAPGHTYFDDIYRQLNDGKWHPDPNRYEEFTLQFYYSMTMALQELKAEGLFDQLVPRRRPILLATILDNSDQNWLEYRSAEYLNPVDEFRRFAADMHHSDTRNYKNSLEQELIRPSSTHRAFIERLNPVGSKTPGPGNEGPTADAILPPASANSPLVQAFLGKWSYTYEVSPTQENSEWPSETGNTIEMSIALGRVHCVKHLSAEYLAGLRARIEAYPIHLYRLLWEGELNKPEKTWDGVYEVLEINESERTLRVRYRPSTGHPQIWHVVFQDNEHLLISHRRVDETDFSHPSPWVRTN